MPAPTHEGVALGPRAWLSPGPCPFHPLQGLRAHAPRLDPNPAGRPPSACLLLPAPNCTADPEPDDTRRRPLAASLPHPSQTPLSTLLCCLHLSARHARAAQQPPSNTQQLAGHDVSTHLGMTVPSWQKSEKRPFRYAPATPFGRRGHRMRLPRRGLQPAPCPTYATALVPTYAPFRVF
jgi:hypothetical protein